MRKPEAHFYRCQHCDSLLEAGSPPPREAYRNGRIDISSGFFLLDLPRTSQSHAASLDGIYCNLECLIAYIKAARAKGRAK